jgi:hypothetical protein
MSRQKSFFHIPSHVHENKGFATGILGSPNKTREERSMREIRPPGITSEIWFSTLLWLDSHGSHDLRRGQREKVVLLEPLEFRMGNHFQATRGLPAIGITTLAQNEVTLQRSGHLHDSEVT